MRTVLCNERPTPQQQIIPRRTLEGRSYHTGVIQPTAHNITDSTKLTYEGRNYHNGGMLTDTRVVLLC